MGGWPGDFQFDLGPPTCCPDETGGQMVPAGDGWLCVWCGREVGADEPRRQLLDRPRPRPTAIPGPGRVMAR